MSTADPLPRALPEVLVSPRRAGEFVVSNPFTRTHAVGDLAFVGLLAALAAPADLPTDAPELAGPFRVADATRSIFVDGLLGDPTGLDRDVTLDGAEAVDLAGALDLARRLRFAVDDEAAYAEFLRGRRNSVLDRAHRGNMHQLAGEHVLMDLRRKSVDEWWVDQKFTPDRREPREGLYSDVQWVDATARYDEAAVGGKRILDFGCGPGLFARLFAARGATVLGLDTNEEHLATARALAADDGLESRTEFRTLELPPETGLATLGDERFDMVFLSDVLMFYFHPYDPALDLDPAALLQQLTALLAPGGQIHVLEPNGVFWQQAWMGAPDRPFTILTEYRHRAYGVTPTLESLSRAAESAGLAIVQARELAAEPESGDHDRARGFAAEFPPWWLFVLERRAAS